MSRPPSPAPAPARVAHRSTGLASSFRSVPDLWHHRIGSTPDAEAMRFRDRGEWRTMTWGEAGARVRAIGNALLALGVAPEQRCAVLADTTVEWILADFAILCAGAATTTVYPQAADAEVVYILGDCEAVAVFVDGPAQVERLVRLRPHLPRVRQVILLHGAAPAAAAAEGWIVPLAEFERRGQAWGAEHPEAYTLAHRRVGPDSLATLMYTSGTTGPPKGVMLTHDGWVYEAEAIDALGFMNPADVHLLWLPLAHVFAKVLELTFVRLGIPTVVDGSAEGLVANLRQTRPTWFAGVPRTFEKARDAILRSAELGSPVRRRLFHWALALGRRRSQAQQAGQRIGVRLSVQLAIADRLVFQEIRDRFGGRLRFMISGGAPLPREVAEFFHALGVLILEGYGLTESSAASCVNRLDSYRFGTVGLPLPGCEVSIAPSGEILLRSRGVMRGYWRRDTETRAAIDGEGWLHTGDLGRILQSGHVEITGRLKEIIVTAGGKNVAPSQFEERLRARCPYVSQVVVHGDGRPFCVALLTLEPGHAARWANDHGVAFAGIADLATRPEVADLLQGYVDAVNRELASFEQVKRFAVLPEDFTLENGLVTPSLKVKRREVERRYSALIEGLYNAWQARSRAG